MLDPPPPVTDGTALRMTYGCYPSGVAALCALGEDEPIGMAASSFTAVSLDPPLVSVCIQTTSETWPRLRDRPRVGISVLAESHGEACRSLSRKEGDRFAGVTWDATPAGAVFVVGATAWFECTVEREIPAGDHVIVLLRIAGTVADPEVPPLVFHGSRFRLLAVVADERSGTGAPVADRETVAPVRPLRANVSVGAGERRDRRTT